MNSMNAVKLAVLAGLALIISACSLRPGTVYSQSADQVETTLENAHLPEVMQHSTWTGPALSHDDANPDQRILTWTNTQGMSATATIIPEGAQATRLVINSEKATPTETDQGPSLRRALFIEHTDSILTGREFRMMALFQQFMLTKAMSPNGFKDIGDRMDADAREMQKDDARDEENRQRLIAEQRAHDSYGNNPSTTDGGAIDGKPMIDSTPTGDRDRSRYSR